MIGSGRGTRAAHHTSSRDSRSWRRASSWPPPSLLFMNAAVGAAAADVPIEDWMHAALPPQIVNETWELQGALEPSPTGQSAECSPQVAPGEESMPGSSTPCLRGKYANKNITILIFTSAVTNLAGLGSPPLHNSPTRTYRPLSCQYPKHITAVIRVIVRRRVQRRRGRSTA